MSEANMRKRAVCFTVAIGGAAPACRRPLGRLADGSVVVVADDDDDDLDVDDKTEARKASSQSVVGGRCLLARWAEISAAKEDCIGHTYVGGSTLR